MSSRFPEVRLESAWKKITQGPYDKWSDTLYEKFVTELLGKVPLSKMQNFFQQKYDNLVYPNIPFENNLYLLIKIIKKLQNKNSLIYRIWTSNGDTTDLMNKLDDDQYKLRMAILLKLKANKLKN